MILAQPVIYFEEAMELEYAVAEIEPLAFLLGQLLAQLCARLAERSLAAGAIRMRFELEPSLEFEIRNSKFETRADKQFKVVEHNRRPELAPNIYERNLNLALPMSDSTMLLKLLMLHLQADAPSAPVLKINLAAEAARPRVSQGELFSPISPDPEKVELTLARLAKLVGAANIGSPELLDTHRPEGFRMLRFVPNCDSVDTPRLKSSAPDGAGELLKTALRLFRPALPARVEVRQGCPARVAFPGIRGRVVAASGPWRGSGDWWNEDAWQSDEWDVEIQFDYGLPHLSSPDNPGVKGGPQRGVYRLFYDLTRQEWFVRGAYD
jgi:protein ImuB